MESSGSDSKAPSGTGSFLRGFFSGATNSVLATTLVNGVAMAATAITTGALSLAAAPVALPMMGIIATAFGIFGGIQSLRRNHEEATAVERVSRDIVRDTQMIAANRDLTQTVDAPDQDMTADETPDRRAWTSRTQRNLQASSRLQTIMDKGNKAEAGAEKHLEALMREREQAALMAATQERSQ